MSNMKCPFCQQELQPVSNFDNQDKRCVWYCPKCATNKRLWVMANERVWQELIRTRKALDKAKNGLKELKDIIACPPDVSYETCVSMYADGVLQEITALEQKDK